MSDDDRTPPDPENRDLALPTSPFGGRVDLEHKRSQLEARLFGVESEPIRIGRYVVLRKLGAGGMSIVYAAYDETLDRKVAVKMLQRTRPDERAETLARLQREARAMARLSHPNVATVHEIGEHEGELFLAMEYVDGPSLRRWLDEERTPAEVLAVVTAAARGIAAAHDKGIVHRDIKPDNIVVGQTVKAIDFGLALAEPGDAPPEGVEGADTLPHTQGLSGTPMYMAPEQFEGSPPSPATDQFSFCVTAWEALCGAHPHPLSEREEPHILGAPRTGPRSVPRHVASALSRGMDPDPTQRFASMAALVDALKPPRTGAKVAVVGVALGLLGGGWALQRGEEAAPCSGAEDALGEAWDAARREETLAAMGEAGQSFGARTAAFVGEQLDAYADAWQRGHVDACRASARGEQSAAMLDARMRCLDRARRVLDVSTRLLAEGDPEVAERATEIVTGLPRLQLCADLDVLQSEVQPPPDALAEAVDAVRAGVDEAEALRLAGRYDALREHVEALHRRAVELDYPPISSETGVVRGRALAELGDYEAASDALPPAVSAAMGQRQWPLALEGALELARLHGQALDHPEEARAWLATVDGLLPLAGADPRADAKRLSIRAAVAQDEGDYAAAQEDLEAALERLESGAPPPVQRAGLLQSLGHVLYRRSDFEGALALMGRGIETIEAELGPEHPQAALLREKRAGVLLDMGKLDEAEEELDRALALETAAWGEDNARVLQGRMLRVNLRRKQGRLDEALAEARDVAALQAEALGPEDLKTLITRGTVAVLVGQTAGFDEAIPLMKAVVDDMVAVSGPRHPSALSLRNNYAVMLMRTKRYEDAAGVLTQLLADKRAALGPTHRSVLDTWVGVAGALGANGDLEAAMQEYSVAIETFASSLPDSDPSMAWARREFGEFLGAFDRPQEATEQFEKAWAFFGQPEMAPAERARLAYNLAMAYVGVDDEALQRWYAVAESAHEDGALPDWEWKNLQYRITRTGDAPPKR